MNDRGMICERVRLVRGKGYTKHEIAYCTLPYGNFTELREAFRAAPQFTQIDADALLRVKPEQLRVVLVTDDSYYARQCAAYLSAMFLCKPDDHQDASEESIWNDPEIDAFLARAFPDDSTVDQNRLELTVISPELLDPNLNLIDDERKHAGSQDEKKKLDTDRLSTDALLVQAEAGAVLSEAVIEEMEALCKKGVPLFIAVKRSQIDRVLIDELCLSLAFQVAHVGHASETYLIRVLRGALKDRGMRLAPDVDLGAVVAKLRSARGTAFTECDLESLACRAPRDREVRTDDLLFETYRPEGGDKRSAMEKLNAMIGMENVKNVLRRQLAACIFEARRSGNGGASMHRCLAFAGSPGTGKTVTARLVADILCEEGCGTGRFVEAGREQLIGKYQGWTSVKIAKAFENARGGVLFIDEAGALVPTDDHDTFTLEAMSALVRHIENEPETVVIFATYGDAMKRLLAADQGLSSRVAQILMFEDYTNEELLMILEKLACDKALAVPKEAREDCLAFFRELRDRKGERFGNGREARRLLEGAVEELALRSLKTHGGDAALRAEDFKAASERLLAQEENGAKRTLPRVGFC